MKTILASILLAVFTVTAFAQSDVVRIDITKLTPDQLKAYQELKAMERGTSLPIDLTKVTPDAIDKYAAIGKSFGTAFKECWTTVSSDAEKFANSDAGKLTMVLIAWKIVGQDGINLVEKAVQYSVGVPLLFIGTFFFIYLFRRNCISRPRLKSATKIGFLTVKREYEGMTDPPHDNEAMILYGIAYAAFVGICALIVFAG